MNNLVDKLIEIKEILKDRISSISANVLDGALNLVVEDRTGGYMLDTLLLQQSEMGFNITEIEINEKETKGKVTVNLEGTEVCYSWNPSLGVWD